MRIRNVSPVGDIDIPLLGRTVKAGEELDVPDELAGAEPGPWRAATDDDPTWLTRVLDDGTREAYTPGHGLLETGLFARVATEPTPKPARTTPQTVAADTAGD